ncbi:MAG: glutaredoxin family protein [Thermodesulfovibrionales bacterium]
MFTLSTCVHCRKAKRFMDDCRVAYEFTDVDLLTGEERSVTIEEVRKLNEALTFPTIVIGDSVIVGFDEDAIKAALGI